VQRAEPAASLERDAESLGGKLVRALGADSSLDVPMDGGEMAVEQEAEELRRVAGSRD
jgi:hypothetical protein